MTEHFQKTVTIKAVDEENRTATGAVLVPNELDHQGDFFRPEAVERFHSDDVDTGVMHSAFPSDAAEFERLEVIDGPETIDGEEFPAGTLVGTRKYHDEELWQLVSDGVLTGFSIGGDVDDAADHESVPDDVRIPDSVDATRDDGAIELQDGGINEVSDVDIPAVPRARYKSTLGKAIMDDVDGEEEFVDLMTEERGHSETDARRLYEYLSEVREANKAADTEKPFESPQGAEFEDFNDCVSTLMDSGMTEERARQTCGAWQSETKVDVNGTEIDLTPPVSMVNAAQAAAEAGDAGLIPSDCGTGVGDDRRQQILDGEISADIVREIAAYLDSHEEDVTASGAPSEWSDEEWSDCGNAQYAKWGGTGGGGPMRWAKRRVNEIDRARDDPITYEEVTNVSDKNITDPAFSVGDAVMWTWQDEPVHGRVADIGEQFTVSGNTITGDEGEAVYLIHDWDEEAEAFDVEGTAKPQSSLSESQMEMPTVDEADTKASLLTRVKSMLFGSNDGTSPEAPDQGAAGESVEKDAPAGDTADETETMTEDTEKAEEPPAWADDLTEKVESIEKRVSEMEEGEEAEKALADAPEWAQNIAEKVDDLDDRVETISKQSGHSQQLGKTAEEEEETEKSTGFTLDPRKSKGGK